MANIKKLEMAAALMARPDIEISTSFFGLCTKAVYLPTRSPLIVKKNDYAPEAAARIQRLLDAPAGRVAVLARDLKLEKMDIGNVRLDVCVSKDHQFAALQMLRFGDYLYRPVGEPRFYEGDDAQAVASLVL